MMFCGLNTKVSILLKSLIAFSIFNLTGAAYAQVVFENKAFKFQRFTETDGLVSSEVTALYKDRRGFLWISTFNGVSRFDGRSFENFSQLNGLPDNNVEVMGEDGCGNIYMKSINNIYRFTGNSLNPFEKYATTGAFLNSCCQDTNGLVWINYMDSKNVELLSPGGRIKTLSFNQKVSSIARSGDGILYVLQVDGVVYRFTKGEIRYAGRLNPKQPYLSDGMWLQLDPQNRVWGYAANSRFIFRYDNKGVADSLEISPQHWWIWFAAANKRYYMPSDSGGIIQYTDGKWDEVINHNQIKGVIYDLFEVNKNFFWIASSNGLIKVSRKSYENKKPSFPFFYFTRDKQNNSILKADSLLYHIPKAISSGAEIGNKNIYSVYVTPGKDIWYCTRKAMYYLPFGGNLQKLPTDKTYQGADILFDFRRVAEDGHGGTWISSYHGVFYYSGGRLNYFYNREGIKEDALYSGIVDRNGIFYASGVRVYALCDTQFNDISPDLGLSYEITRLSKDRLGNVWACQGRNKIVRIGYHHGKFFPADSLILTVNGQDFIAQSVCFDAANNLWITDNHSLYFYRHTTNGYRSNGYPVSWEEHLISNPALFTDGQKHLMALSTPMEGNYLRSYQTDSLLLSGNAPAVSVWLTGLELNRKPYDWYGNGFETDPFGIPRHLSLSYKQNFLRFYFSATTVDLDHQTVYRYRLVGLDKAWSPPRKTGEAEYTGIPPGDYTLEIQARNPGGNWSSPLKYRFNIAPAWYFTWQAIVCWVLLGGLVVMTGFFFIWRLLNRRARFKQLVVEEQLKALRAQINPHFLQNTFAFLAHEIAIETNAKSIESLDQVSSYLRKVLRFSDQTAVPLEEELEFAADYLKLQQQLISIHFNYIIEVAPDVDLFDTLVPAMLLQPIIENSLKYGLQQHKENIIKLLIHRRQDWVECIVSDTGASDSQQWGGTGKGINMTINRMDLFYGNKQLRPEFSMQVNTDGGTDVIIRLPLK